VVRSAIRLNRPQPGERRKRVEGAGADIHLVLQDVPPVTPRYGVHHGISIARSDVRSALMNPLLWRVAH
jgi:hypothetical protein